MIDIGIDINTNTNAHVESIHGPKWHRKVATMQWHSQWQTVIGLGSNKNPLNSKWLDLVSQLVPLPGSKTTWPGKKRKVQKVYKRQMAINQSL